MKNLSQEFSVLLDSNAQSSIVGVIETQNHVAPLLVSCREMADFSRSNLESIRLAFQQTAPSAMRQAWLKTPEIDFAPGLIWTGWQKDSLLVFAELTDMDIFNGLNDFNGLPWEAGDVFEIFLRPLDQSIYFEFHVTPCNQRLQLRFTDSKMVDSVRKSKSIENVLIREEMFQSLTWVRPEIQQWFVYAEIPAGSICSNARSLEGSQWQFSFCRYDYTRGRKMPVISSTSYHVVPDFHRQHEWGLINFIH